MTQRSKKKEQLASNIAKLRKAIRKKYRKFKRGEVEFATELEKQYKPIISELKKSETLQHHGAMRIKKDEDGETKMEEDENEYNDYFSPQVFSSPGGIVEKTVVQPLRDEDLYGDVSPKADVSSVLSTVEGQESASRYINDRFDNALTKQYMKLLMGGLVQGGRTDQIDNVFGP